MTGLLQDIRYALRQLRKSPGFTAVAVISLALGIGANTGIFTLLNAVLLKSLPVPNPEQLYLVNQGDFEPHNTRFAYPMFQNARAAMPGGSELTAASFPGQFYAQFGAGEPEMVTGQLVSGNYFATLETSPAKGRLLGENDDRLDMSPVAVISYGSWERHFGLDPNVVGRKVTVNGMPAQIVGVTARGFFGAQVGTAPEFWLPTAMQSTVRYQQHYSEDTNAKTEAPWVLQPDIRWLQFIIRVKSPKLVGQTSAALNQVFHLALGAEQERDPSERQAILRRHLNLTLGARGSPSLRTDFSRPLLALMAMVGIILLITCANLANLLLARAAAREHEIAVRLSIGAGRTRLVRQMFVECFLLSASGTLLGSAIAYWLREVLPKWVSSGGDRSIVLNLAPDERVLFFSAAVGVLTGIAFGLAPALYGIRVQPIGALKSAGRLGGRAEARWSLKQALVSFQVALSLVLVIGAGLFIRTLENFNTIDAGFDRDHLVTVDLDTHLAGYSHEQLKSLYRSLIDRVEATPGVRSASLLSCEIAAGCGDASDIYLPNVPHTNGETDAQERRVSQEFFASTGISLLEGRLFADLDTEESPKVVVVNQAFVREFLPWKNPIGQYYGYDALNPRLLQIVGVVKDSRINDVREDVPPTVYHSLSQDVQDVGSLNVRTFGDPAQLVRQIRETVQSVDPRLPIGNSSTVAEVVSEGLWGYRLIARLTTMFGLLALALASIGLYGVMSYNVSRRTAELGIRLALGAPRRAVLWLVMRHVLVLVGAGLSTGYAIALLSVHALRSLLFGLSPYDPATMASAAVVLIIVAGGAGLKPAWKAARVDPIVALRYE
jgi:predicted permease